MRAPRLLLAIGLVVAVGVAAAIGWYADGRWQFRAAYHALMDYGFGETTLMQAERSHCPFGYGTVVFLAQGGRIGRESTGYVCVSYFHAPNVTVTRLEGADRTIDWEPRD